MVPFSEEGAQVALGIGVELAAWDRPDDPRARELVEGGIVDAKQGAGGALCDHRPFGEGLGDPGFGERAKVEVRCGCCVGHGQYSGGRGFRSRRTR